MEGYLGSFPVDARTHPRFGALERRWENGYKELDYDLGEPSAEYLAWVEKQKGETYEDCTQEYNWDKGIAS